MNSIEGGKRRNFLKIVAAGAGAVLGSYVGNEINFLRGHHKDWGIDFDFNDKELSFDEAAQFTRRIGKVFTELNLSKWKPELTQEFLTGWVLEAADQIQDEGLVANVRLPASFDFFYPDSGDMANHVLGYSDCSRYVRLNSRFLNPATPWYNSPWSLGTIVHEMVHFEAQAAQ